PEPEKLSSETKDIIRKQFLEKFNNGDTPPEEIDDILTFLERLNKDEDPANSQIEDPRRDMAVPPLLRETPLAPNSMQGIPGIKVSPAKPEVYGPPPPSKPDVYDQMMNQNYLPRTEDGVLYEQLNSFMRSNLNSPLKPAHNSGTAPPPTSGKPISPDEESESISTPVPSPSVPSPLAAGSSAPKPEAPALRRPAAAPASPSGETQPPANPMGSSSPMGSSGHGPGSGTPASTPSSGSGSATQPRSNDLSLTKPFLAIPKTSPGPWVSLDEASETPGSTAPTALKKGPKEDPKKEIPQQTLPGAAKEVPALRESEGTPGTSLFPSLGRGGNRDKYVNNDNMIRQRSGASSTSPAAPASPAAPSTFDNSPT
ncbi:hypothetical protein EBT16_14590, partial [bacterium]|nr:hypothetical protein [bacterium]